MTTIVTDDRASLHVQDSGGTGPAILFLHDLDCDGHYWEHVLDRVRTLAPEVRFLVMDLRGHGASGWGEAPSRKRLVKDCKRVCKELHVDHPLVVGHGLGADIALAFEDAGAVVAINPRLGREDAVPFPADLERPEFMHGAANPDVLDAYRVGLASAKPLRRTKRDAPVLLVFADPADADALADSDTMEHALDVYGIQQASRHLPIEMPSAVAALVCSWMQEAM